MGCANYGAFVAMTSINVLSIAALIAATSAPDPSASPSALKLIVSRSCEWPEPVGLREVCGDVVEGRLLSRLADTAVTATPATRMWVAFVPRGCGPSGKARAQEEISRSPKKQVTKPTPTQSLPYSTLGPSRKGAERRGGFLKEGQVRGVRGDGKGRGDARVHHLTAWVHTKRETKHQVSQLDCTIFDLFYCWARQRLKIT